MVVVLLVPLETFVVKQVGVVAMVKMVAGILSITFTFMNIDIFTISFVTSAESQ